MDSLNRDGAFISPLLYNFILTAACTVDSSFCCLDIGVAVEYGGMYAVGQHTFDDSRRTGGAAGVKQHAVVAVGSLEFEHSHGLETGIVGLSVSLGQRYGEKCSVCIYLGRNLVTLC